MTINRMRWVMLPHHRAPELKGLVHPEDGRASCSDFCSGICDTLRGDRPAFKIGFDGLWLRGSRWFLGCGGELAIVSADHLLHQGMSNHVELREFRDSDPLDVLQDPPRVHQAGDL